MNGPHNKLSEAARPGRWQVISLGVNHTTTTVEQRRSLQIAPRHLAEFQTRLFQSPGIMESAILATCNRVEFYLVTSDKAKPGTLISQLYQDLGQQFDAELLSHFYVLREEQAVEHLFRVAAGIDSMVIGENQIFGQLKDAFSSACQLKTVGRILQRAFHQAFRVGKQIRNETAMGQGVCSVSSAAIDLLRDRMSQFDRPDVLFVGAGRMISLAASRAATLPVGRLHFANRTQDRAEALAQAYGYEGHDLGDLPDLLNTADVVISCTGAHEVVITSAMLDRASRLRSGRPLLLIDLAMPPDIEHQPGRYDAISVCNLDDIKDFVGRNQEKREAEIPKAELLVAQRLAEFMYWYSHVHLEADRVQLNQALENIRQQELERVLAKLPLELRTELTDASRNLVEKVLQVKDRLSDTGSN